MLIEEFAKLRDYRDLLRLWTMRHIRIRYKQSLLGGAWAILQPLSLTLIFTIVFTYIVHVPTGGVPYPVFSYSAMLPWTFLAVSLAAAVTAITQDMNLVTKIYFPREILPASGVFAALVDLGVGALILIGMLLVYRLPLSPKIILIPVLVATQTALVLGLALIIAALNVYYRDFRFVVPLGIQLWFYATPIIYPLALVPEQLRPLYMLNPMTGIIEAYRAVLLYDAWPAWPYLLAAVAFSATALLGGYWIFKRLEASFADII